LTGWAVGCKKTVDVDGTTITAGEKSEEKMEYSELIAMRYSVRAYLPNPVEDEKLQAILEAARLAPTAANRQPVQLIVMHTAGREEEIGQIYSRPWFVQAPLVIAVCVISSLAWVRESDRFNARLIDAAIVADHLILAAANLGLGTCWVAAFNVEAARSVLQLPDEAEPVIFTPLGYPADEPGLKTRKLLNELVRYEHW
jgi:nitroreductase